MKEDGFPRVLVRGDYAKKDGGDSLEVRNETEVLRKHVASCGNDDNMFRLERGDVSSKAASPGMITDYI